MTKTTYKNAIKSILSRQNAIIAISILFLLIIVFNTVAQAANMNNLDNCVLVPRVTWRSGTIANASTAIGLINRDTGVIYWGFYDANGTNLTNGIIPATDTVTFDSLTPFLWDPAFTPEASGFGNLIGYMLFCLDTDDDTFITTSDAATLAAMKPKSIFSQPRIRARH